MRKVLILLFTGLLMASCGSDSVEGNPSYLTSDMIVVEIQNGVNMFFWKNDDGTVDVTYDRNNPLHTNINSGISNNYYKGTITIPGTIQYNGASYTVTGITESAFMNCSQLTKVIIPASVKTIGTMAFYNCQSLQEVIVMGSLEEIPDYCFSGCRALTKLSVAGQVKRLGVEAFARCSSLESLQVPDGVTTIDTNCFLSSGLVYCFLPESLTDLRKFSFNSCTKLNEIIIPKGVTALQDSVFSGCSKMLTAYLPETLISLGEGTFAGCYSMIEVTIPAKVKSIGKGCFCSVNSSGVSNWKKLTLTVMPTTPPTLTGSISNATERKRIVVPRGYRDTYMTTAYWDEFTEVMERNY